MFKVLVCDPISDEGVQILIKESDIQVDIKLKLSEDEICDIISDYHAVIVRSETKITAKILEKAAILKVVGRAGVGVDNIDVDEATTKGVVVVNAPDGNTISACEHTMALLLAMARNVPRAHQSLVERRWDRAKFMGVELRGKKIGILGFGRIGAEVAIRCRAFGMEVLAYDPYITEERAEQFNVRQCSKETIYQEADFITVHLPKTPETTGIINKESFAMMKPTTRLLNVARGGIINEQDLFEALSENKIAGAAIDVFETEPQTESPLFDLPQVVVTPHLGASTEEAQVMVALDVVEEIIRILRGEPVHNAVNIPFVKPELMRKMEPYLVLAEKLGKITSALTGAAIKDVEVRYAGEVANEEIRPMTNTLLKGLLRAALGESVNYVNAPLVARNRGIKVTVAQDDQSQDYMNQIRVVIVDENNAKHTVAGTVFQNGEIHIIQIDGFVLDIRPEGRLLLIPHQDQPKMIGPVGMLLGEANINIAGMQMGRENIGGSALMVITVDNEVPVDMLKKVEQIKGIEKASYLEF